MVYYVVRVQLPSQQVEALVFALNSNENLMDQVHEKVGNQFIILSINLLGVDWP
jgi:hypothetical protein